jgi:predicted DNA binding protein
MPGPISDTYDPEFSTGERAAKVREAIEEQRNRLNAILGDRLLYIVDIVENKVSQTVAPVSFKLTEREMRIIRFALNRAIESI